MHWIADHDASGRLRLWEIACRHSIDLTIHQPAEQVAAALADCQAEAGA